MIAKIKQPPLFEELVRLGCINSTDVVGTDDGFSSVYKSVSAIMAVKGIIDFPDSKGETLACDMFFDDWYLYAVSHGQSWVYGLFKLREQEYDLENGLIADGDTPGVTVSFIEFNENVLLNCLNSPTNENRSAINREINRVVAYGGQRHHKELKRYFKDPKSSAAYLIASLYVRHVASFACDGYIDVPKHYKETVRKSALPKSSAKLLRLPQFIASLNKSAGRVVCDNEKIYIGNKNDLSSDESLAILATHTANVSVFSFAAEIEYHARYLLPIARVRLPFLGKSIYESAIRADMTIDDTELEGPAPFYRLDSKIVKRQRAFHKETAKLYKMSN